jgi:phosphonate transport system substrate-binding protein
MAHLGTFGIPLVAPGLSHEPGHAFVGEISRRLGSPLELAVFDSYSEICDALAEGRIDFAWLPPLEAHLLCDHAGVVLLLQALRGGQPCYHSAIFTREDSPLRDARDLNDLHVAYVHRRSASGFLAAAAHLLDLGVRTALPPLFLGSHGAVVQAVWEQRADAGATYVTFEGEKMVEAGWLQVEPARPMRTLAIIGPVPTDAICAWPGTSRSARTDLVEALHGCMEDPAASAVMARLFGTSRFVPAGEGSYELIDRAFARLRPAR